MSTMKGSLFQFEQVNAYIPESEHKNDLKWLTVELAMEGQQANGIKPQPLSAPFGVCQAQKHHLLL